MDQNRRNFLQQSLLLTSGIFLPGYSRSTGDSFFQVDDHIKKLVRSFGRKEKIHVLTEAEEVQSFGSDFGHIYHSVPEAVFQPGNISEIQRIMKFLEKEKLPVVIRGKGHSQSGQSIPVSKGVTLDMTRMENMRLNETNIFCEAGCTWRQIVEYGKSKRLMPPVMPMYVDLSVGGTISAGGIGSSSFRYGIASSIVEEMEVVLANGELVKCNRTRDAEIFNAVLANTGRVGVICSASLQLRMYKPYMLTYYLLYDDIHQWLHDQQLLMNTNCEHIQGFFSHSIQGLKNGKPFLIWFYGLQASFEFETDKEKDFANAVVRELKPYKRLGEESTTTAEFSHRFDPRFKSMQQSGAFSLPHPWMEFLLPSENLESLIPAILEKLPFAMGDGHRLVFINSQHLPENFQTPHSSSFACFAALPTGIPAQQLPDVLPRLKEVNDFVLANGGKRYLSGWLGAMKPLDWKAQFDTRFDKWTNQKHRLDPNHIFRSMLFDKVQKK